MEITVALGILAGLVATIVTAIINHPSWPSHVKRGVSLAVSAVWAVVAALASGLIVGVPMEVTDWVVRILIMVAGVVVSAQGIYAQFKDILENLERKTSGPAAPGPGVPDGPA